MQVILNITESKIKIFQDQKQKNSFNKPLFKNQLS